MCRCICGNHVYFTALSDIPNFNGQVLSCVADESTVFPACDIQSLVWKANRQSLKSIWVRARTHTAWLPAPIIIFTVHGRRQWTGRGRRWAWGIDTRTLRISVFRNSWLLSDENSKLRVGKGKDKGCRVRATPYLITFIYNHFNTRACLTGPSHSY